MKWKKDHGRRFLWLVKRDNKKKIGKSYDRCRRLRLLQFGAYFYLVVQLTKNRNIFLCVQHHNFDKRWLYKCVSSRRLRLQRRSGTR